ncbi:2-C-methyl-D-erythritol 4-phosphate cytidylyltransferase [Corynebacterium phocae]|uniref:2-C-methyl-D-erythritol 4-phosphate cytidylyltransferase n=1 Tax=Corynebacterium phocae TaxID=161895 RepID=A0A1L7D192_9CORY|nr:2-C-methyl-D-erythritol 4-phosphate cytidylyltransferase [Corynebacterium phocae]APT91909.1 2-C-methyl-D-erythritol 4-phosphate cytidylyltransferase [Corynebacterium phocae]KAA8727367.1 2-C-methyl-D-erythritol 4-phosphate cytidylyltransferase [Corynebacterium phocae]
MPRPVIALIAAAGQGTRLGADVPKAFVPLDGVSLVGRSVRAMARSGVVDGIVVLVSPEMEATARQLLQREVPETPVRLVHGGGERADSVWAGLQALEHPGPATVLIHDAARALVPPEMIARVAGAVAAGSPAVVPVVPVADTIKNVDGDHVLGTPDRAGLRAVQTPQGFDLGQLLAANRAYFAGHPDFVATDDASLMEWHGATVKTVDGDPLAFKITTPIDLVLARAVLEGALSP